MRAAFFGTPAWAVPSFLALVDSGVDVSAVVTSPDRPAGRGMEMRGSPVKGVALEHGIEVLQPNSARDPDFAGRLEAMDLDVGVVVAYGKILPLRVLEAPRRGLVNVHFSLLPAYRGAAPVQRALIDGRTETGVSLFVLTEGMDEGPILAAERTSISEGDTAGSLGERLAAVGARVLAANLAGYVEGELRPVPQNESDATYAPKMSTDEARIDWRKGARQVRNLVRGLNPAPGAWTSLRGRRVKVHEVIPASEGLLQPGEIEAAGELIAGTGDGSLALIEVQPEGKRAMRGTEFARGLRLQKGERFE